MRPRASRRDDVSALILAGGQATRMGGRDKRTLVVDGRTIFERQVEVLAPRVAEILVSARAPVAGYRTVRDARPGAGPLAGIAAGLAATATRWLLVVAGDMPWIAGAVIDQLLACAAAPREAAVDAVGIRIGPLPEPLLCVLRVATARPEVERRLATGRYKASELLTGDGLAVTWLDEGALRSVDPELRSLRNVNTPADLGAR